VARGVGVARFEVYQVDLEPTRGSEIRKSRPCLIISPDEMNRHLRTVIVAPMTTQGRAYPSRVAVNFRGTQGQVVLDQIRTVGKMRLVRRLGTLDQVSARRVLDVLAEMFAP
jgi:mRNA interferase MazF